MIGYFKKIDLGYDEATKEILVPSWRQDLLCDADMAEEVARFYGYDKIGTSLPSGESTAGGKSFKRVWKKRHVRLQSSVVFHRQ